MQRQLGESQPAYSALADKPIHGYQTLGDRIDGEEQTFESYGAEQHRAVGRNEAWSRNLNPIQREARLGHGPHISLSAGDYDSLRTGGFQCKSFNERAWYHAECSASVDKKLNVFTTIGRPG